MENNVFKLLTITSMILIPNIALAKTIYFGGATETVPIAYGTATILRFEDAVKTISHAENFIIKPVNEENPDYAVLSIEPRNVSGKEDTVFILASGETAKLRLSIVPAQAKMKLESVYEVKSQKNLIETKAESAPYVGRLELMTAMIRGDQITGYEMTKMSRDVSNGSDAAKVTLQKVYSGNEFKGYVFMIQNHSKFKTFALDVRKLVFGRPNQAVLAYSDQEELGQSGSETDKTRLIVVTKPTAFYQDAVLPIRIVPKKPEDDKVGGEHE